MDPSPPPKSSTAGVIIIPVAEMRKSRLGGQNLPRAEESVCYPRGSGAGGELEKEKQPPYHFKRGSSKRLFPVGFTALKRRQQERIWWNAPTWGPGGPGEPSDPCAHEDCVVSSSRMRFFMSGERSFNAKQHMVIGQTWGTEEGSPPGHSPAPQSSPQDW